MSGHVCDTCFDKGKTESCLVKAPAMHASESVLVIGELLCTSVQANTETHKERNARKCAHVGDTNNNGHPWPNKYVQNNLICACRSCC